MKNADMPAMPIEDYLGLTKYEEILARFMSAMLSDPHMRHSKKRLIDEAKLFADAYFEHLETKTPA